MGRYFIQRLLQAIPIILFVSFIAFSIAEFAPGDPLIMYLPPDETNLSPEQMEMLRNSLGLNSPWYIRYFSWAKNLLSGNWGYSIIKRTAVLDDISAALPNTLMLGGFSLLFTIIVAVPLGVISAVKRYSFIDYFLTTFSFLGLSLPSFWFALILIEIFSIWLGWLPSVGMHSFASNMSPLETMIDTGKHLILPMLTLSLSSLAHWSRYQRAVLLENLAQDFTRTARAKGLKERNVIMRHAFRNSLVPMVTLLGLSMPMLVSGSIITETIFAWPGMGRLAVESIFRRDYPLIMGVVVIISAVVIVGNLLADLLYGIVDPRIRVD